MPQHPDPGTAPATPAPATPPGPTPARAKPAGLPGTCHQTAPPEKIDILVEKTTDRVEERGAKENDNAELLSVSLLLCA